MNREGADVGGMRVGGEECPVGKCYRGGLRLSIGVLAHAGSVMIEEVGFLHLSYP